MDLCWRRVHEINRCLLNAATGECCERELRAQQPAPPKPDVGQSCQEGCSMIEFEALCECGVHLPNAVAAAGRKPPHQFRLSRIPFQDLDLMI